MKTPLYAGQFRRDVKRMEKRGKEMSNLRNVILILLEGSPLPERLRDHPLKGEWMGCRDFHIERDWLLIYKASGDSVLLERTGTHSDLFDE